MKKQKFLLICLYDFESYGVRCLSANLMKNDISYTVLFFQNLDFNNLRLPEEDDWLALKKFILEHDAEYIGLSLRSPVFKIAKEMTQRIRQYYNGKIVWGGAHPTIEPDECLEFADAVFTGEGENSLVQFLQNDFGTPIEGVSYKGDNHHNIVLVNNLDSLPPPLYENSHCYHQIADVIDEGDPLIKGDYMEKYGESYTYETMTSRGCPFNCTYCSSPIVSKRKVRIRNVDKVIDEILDMKKIMRIERICFIDEVFGLNMDWLKEFTTKYREKIHIPFTAEIHPNMITQERIDLYKSAGMIGVELGIQSGSEDFRKNVLNRDIKQQVIYDGINLLVKSGITVTIDIIIDNPYETEKDLKASFDLINTIPRCVGVKVFSLSLLPKTVLTERLLNEGLIQRNQVEQYACKTHHMWRARIDTHREPWRRFWSNMIIIASLRNLSAGQNWLATPTNIDENSGHIHIFSNEDLDRMAHDKLYRDNPALLEEIIFSNIHESQRKYI